MNEWASSAIRCCNLLVTFQCKGVVGIYPSLTQLSGSHCLFHSPRKLRVFTTFESEIIIRRLMNWKQRKLIFPSLLGLSLSISHLRCFSHSTQQGRGKKRQRKQGGDRTVRKGEESTGDVKEASLGGKGGSRRWRLSGVDWIPLPISLMWSLMCLPVVASHWNRLTGNRTCRACREAKMAAGSSRVQFPEWAFLSRLRRLPEGCPRSAPESRLGFRARDNHQHPLYGGKPILL